jgi:hypothetical protein
VLETVDASSVKRRLRHVRPPSFVTAMPPRLVINSPRFAVTKSRPAACPLPGRPFGRGFGPPKKWTAATTRHVVPPSAVAYSSFSC